MPAAHVNAYDCAPTVARRMRRRAVATAVVASVYVMLALAAPWLVRYGAEFTPAVVAATQPGAANAGAPLRDGAGVRPRVPGRGRVARLTRRAAQRHALRYTSTRSMPPALAFAT